MAEGRKERGEDASQPHPNATENERILFEFMTLTGADADTATQYLEATAYNCELAIGLYFDAAGGTSAGVASSQRPIAQAPSSVALADVVERAPSFPSSGPTPEAFENFHQAVESFIQSAPVESQIHRSNLIEESFATTPINGFKWATLDEAKHEAAAKSRWLLVNVQDPINPSCRNLNYDLWTDATVKDFVEKNFVFFQTTRFTSEGRRIESTYSISSYPSLLFLHWLTGEEMQRIDPKALNSNDFIEKCTTFLEQFAEGNVPTSVPDPDDFEFADLSDLESERRITEMTEDEQLRLAISQSLQNSPKATKRKVPAPLFDAKQNDEPDVANPDACRIQIQRADGSKVSRRFLKGDSVQTLFEYVQWLCFRDSTDHFELYFSKRALSEKLQLTLEEAGVCNANVIVDKKRN